MKFSVADFPAPIGARVFKFCVHFQVGKLYCINEIDANPYDALFKFSTFSYKIDMDIFSVKDIDTKLDSDELYRVTKSATYCISVPFF